MTGSNRLLRLAAWACLPTAGLFAGSVRGDDAPVEKRNEPVIIRGEVRLNRIRVEPAPAIIAEEPAKPVDGKPVEAKPADAKPADAKPADDAAAKEAAAKEAAAKEAAKLDAALRSRRSSRDTRRNQLVNQNLPEREGPIDHYVRLAHDGGFMRLEPVNYPTNNGSSSQFRIKGVDAAWSFSRYNSTAMVPGAGGAMVRQSTVSLNISRTELGQTKDDDYYQTSFNSNFSMTSMSGQSIKRSVSLSQVNPGARGNNMGRAMGGAVTLSVSEWQANQGIRQAKRLTAQSLTDLRARHPAEFREFVVPLLLKISDLSFLAPGATEVYAVLDDVRADEAVSAKLRDLLPQLDAEDYGVRENAARQLRELGPKGVLAALRLDRNSLTDEQAGQLGRFVAEFRRRELPDAAAARNDVVFLADCLEHNDPAVRTSAKKHLERVLSRALPFDPNLAGEALGESADKIRMIIQDAAKPATTQPATPQPVPGDPNVPLPRPEVRPMPGIAPAVIR